MLEKNSNEGNKMNNIVKKDEKGIAAPVTSVPVNTNDGLFYDEPEMVVEKATKIADVLTKLVSNRKLYTVINGNKYVHVTGWNVMLTMLGVGSKPVINDVTKEGGHVFCKTYVELFSVKSGKVIGGGWGYCSSKESKRVSNTEHCIQSMAQTRALGKAARMSFSWVIKLAGYEATPAEEMIEEDIEALLPSNKQGNYARTNSTDTSIAIASQFQRMQPQMVS
ncbi:hypothetical protein GAMM_130021 [Gammaproteobacteria bacterium]